MEKTFTKLLIAVAVAGAISTNTAKAQNMLASADTKKDAAAQKDTVKANAPADHAVATTTQTKADDTWVPQRRVWGYVFGDFYYDGHSDLGNRGPETNYNGVPTYRNAFQFRRIYLGYDYEIDKKFKAEFLLASEPSANTGVNGTTSIQNGDNLVDNKMALWIKNANLRVRDLWTGTDFVIGEQSTPGFALNEPGTNGPTTLSEAAWSYRSIEKTVSDFHKNNSYDLGASLQGTFDPATKNFGYVFMVGNNSQASLLSAANKNTGWFKIFYGDLYANFLDKKLHIDVYADYAKTAVGTGNIPDQEHNMLKGFVYYQFAKPFILGVEAYTQKIGSGITNSTTHLPEDATVNAISIWARGAITPKLNYFARFDHYNPDTKLDGAYTYTVNTNYSSYTPLYKENFWTAGFDYNPIKNVHFEPNLWLVDYKDQRNTTTAGYVANDHTIVYRFTFYFVFGK